MSSKEKTKLRNRLWRRFSKTAPLKGMRRMAVSFRHIFADLFCTNVSTEPQSRAASQTPTASTSEAPLTATSEYMPVHDHLSPDGPRLTTHVDIWVNEEKTPVPVTLPTAARHVAVVVPVTEDTKKARRPLYRPTPLTPSDVVSTRDKWMFGATLNDPRVLFVDRKHTNDRQPPMAPQISVTDDTDNTADVPADINIDAVISELDAIIDNRLDTEKSRTTEDIDVDAVISELDDILDGGEGITKSRVEVGEETARPTHKEEAAAAADIDDLIDEEYNYYGI